MPCSLRVSKIRLSRSWAIFKQFSSLTRAYVRNISCPNTVVVATLETRVASKAKKGSSAGPLLPHRGGISECVGALYLFLSWWSAVAQSYGECRGRNEHGRDLGRKY